MNHSHPEHSNRSFPRCFCLGARVWSRRRTMCCESATFQMSAEVPILLYSICVLFLYSLVCARVWTRVCLFACVYVSLFDYHIYWDFSSVWMCVRAWVCMCVCMSVWSYYDFVKHTCDAAQIATFQMSACQVQICLCMFVFFFLVCARARCAWGVACAKCVYLCVLCMAFFLVWFSQSILLDDMTALTDSPFEKKIPLLFSS